jgi:O-antigen/teichoic acid export membrane protein
VSARRLNAYIRAEVADPLLRSAYSLMLSAALTAGLGLAFWLVAARLYDADDVGRDAALIAVMVELSTICQLNLVNAVTRFLPSLERGTARALLAAYGASGALAVVFAVGFVGLAPLASEEFAFFQSDLRIAALFVAGQVGWGWFVIQDAALTATRNAPWVLFENTAFGALKLLALPALLLAGSGHGVFLAWVLPALLLLAPVNVFLFRRAIPEHVRRHRPARSFLRRLGRARFLRFMALDYGASVFSQGAATVLPVLVVALLGSSANAYFYLPFMSVTAFIMLFYGATSSLVVEGALAEHRIRELVATLARRLAVMVVPGTVVLVAAAPLILLPFGPDYVREGTSVFRLLACACAFQVTLTVYVAIARLQGQGARILAVEAARAGLLLAGAVVLAGPMGLDGIGIAYLASSVVVTLAVLPSLVRFFRSPSIPPGPATLPAPAPQGVAVR